MKSIIPSFSETGHFSVWIHKITTSCPFGPGNVKYKNYVRITTSNTTSEIAKKFSN